MSEPCLMLSLDIDRDMFIEFISSLDEALIDPTEGIEWFNHVTVLYGIKDPGNSTLQLAKLINSMHSFPIKLGKVSFFRTNPDFDVLKVEVESKELLVFNSLVRSLVPYENSYPEYIPHFTIAYVKKGAFDYLEGSDYFQGLSFFPREATLSFSDRSCLDIPFYNSKKL